MNQTLDCKQASLRLALALAMAGMGLRANAAHAAAGEEEAWRAMRPLGRDIPAHRGDGASESQAARARSQDEPGGALTLRQALELALMHSPELAASAHGVRAAAGNAVQAGVWPNPELEIEAEEFGGSGTRKGYDAAQTTARLRQSVELGGKRGKRQSVALSEARVAGWEYEAARLTVLASAKRAFVDVLQAQSHLGLAESLLALAEDVHTAAKQRVAAGKVSPIEETKAGVEVARARIARDRTRREMDTARQRLAASWGGTSFTFKEVRGDLDAVGDVPSLETLSGFVDDTPDVARWNEEVERGKASLALARAARIPDLDVIAGVGRFEDDGGQAGIVGLSLPLPVFNRNAGGILAATHQAARADYEHRAARLRAMTALAEAHSRLETTRMEALTTKAEMLPGAQQAFDAAQTGYREGKFGSLEVLDTLRTLREARARYLDVLAAYHTAAADVEHLLGIPLDTIQ